MARRPTVADAATRRIDSAARLKVRIRPSMSHVARPLVRLSMTCWLNACRSWSCVDARCELRAGAPQAFREVAAQRRHRHETEHVQTNGQHRDPDRRRHLGRRT